jgi:hypothetical protein
MPDMGNPMTQPEQGMDPALTPQAPPDSATGLEGMQAGIETPAAGDNGPAMI